MDKNQGPAQAALSNSGKSNYQYNNEQTR